MISQKRHVIIWKRIKIATKQGSRENHGFLLALLFRNVNSTIVLFQDDGLDFHTTTAVAWFNRKYVVCLSCPASTKRATKTTHLLF